MKSLMSLVSFLFLGFFAFLPSVGMADEVGESVGVCINEQSKLEELTVNCLEVSDPQADARKTDDVCWRGYYYDKSTKKSRWYSTPTKDCKALFKKQDKAAAERKKKKAAEEAALQLTDPAPTSVPVQSTTKPVEPVKTQPAEKPVGPNLFKDKDLKDAIATLKKIKPIDLENARQDHLLIQVICDFPDGDKRSAEERLKACKARFESFESQLQSLQDQIDQERQDRQDGDDALWAALGNNISYARLSFFDGGMATLVNNERSKAFGVVGLELGLGLNNKFGVHGGFGMQPKIVHFKRSQEGGLNVSLGMYQPNLTFNVGLDYKLNQRLSFMLDYRMLFQAVSNVSGFTSSDIDYGIGLGVEYGGFQKRPFKRSTLFATVYVGEETDIDSSETAIITIAGAKFPLFSYKKK